LWFYVVCSLLTLPGAVHGSGRGTWRVNLLVNHRKRDVCVKSLPYGPRFTPSGAEPMTKSLSHVSLRRGVLSLCLIGCWNCCLISDR
jgi:hypothetical protein